nr:RNA-directed DNA polymerase, eukaryota, nucleotide-binding alpha-beta plait domain protein [Tanacetum cinerariifolium]
DCTPKDLWKVCNDYGTVVDVFIPNKKSKAGKCFAFVRFIKEFDKVDTKDSESGVEEVSKTIFGDNSSSPNNNSDEIGKQHSEDPFKIYDILKKQIGGETRGVSSSLSHPPGFTPEEINRESVDPNVVKE